MSLKMNPARRAAFDAGSIRFFGNVCPKHPELNGERYTRAGGCILCSREGNRRENLTPERLINVREYDRKRNKNPARRACKNEYGRKRRAQMTPEQREALRAQVRELQNAWRANNLEVARKRDREWKRKRRATDPEFRAQERERGARHYAENKSQYIANNSKRRAAKLQRTPGWLTPEDHRAIEAYYAEAAQKTQETGVKHVCDHVYPLQGKTVSGLHVPGNLIVMPSGPNGSKGNRDPLEFALS